MSASWQLQPIFGSYLLVAGLAAVLLLLLFLTPAFGQLNQRQKRTLIFLRLALALLLTLGMLRPAIVTINRQTQQALLSILFDASRSMDYRDAVDGKTRWEEQQAILERIRPALNNMGDDFAVEMIAFSGDNEVQPEKNGQPLLKAAPIGSETDIGQAITATLQRNQGKRFAGMILISDGAQRSLNAKVSPQQAAKQLDRRGTALYTVAIGRSRDQSQSRDVAIENLEDEYAVFVKNEFVLRVGIRIQGFVNKQIPVSLSVEDESGVRTKVSTQTVVATQDSQVVMANFSYRAETAGKFRLYVEAEPQPGELIENNQSIAFLNVRDGGVRVLLLSSATLQEEMKFIRRSLAGAAEIELDHQLISVLLRSRWPIDIETKVTLDDYDVIIVGDLDANALLPENWNRIATLVESGRGFMMYGGFHSYGPGGYSETPLAKLLPIEMSAFEREADPTQSTRRDRHIEGDITIRPVGDSSIMHLAPNDANQAAWAALKPLRGANKFDKLKDQATVLAESSNNEPLLVQNNYLAGRVLASAFDSTYRWWKFGQQDAHKRFWRQSILWLARRDKQAASSIFIELPQRRFRSNAKVSFTTGLTDETGDLLPEANLAATLRKPNGEIEQVAMTNSTNGSQGSIAATQFEDAGIYRIEVSASDGTTVSNSSYADFAIVKEDFELSDPAANPGLLDMLSRITSRVGGKAVAPEQLAELIQEIKSSPPLGEIEMQSKWQLGDTWQDAWGSFLLLTSILGIEWYLRKKWGLV